MLGGTLEMLLLIGTPRESSSDGQRRSQGPTAGSLAGRVVTLSKEGFGRWANLGVGMLGAVVGGLLFNVFNIDLGLGDLKVTFEDLIAAFVGSLLCTGVWWLLRRSRAKTSNVADQ